MFEKVLKQRFDPKYFKNILNRNLLFLFEISSRLNLDPTDISREFLSLIYSDETESLSFYQSAVLVELTYGVRNKMNTNEMIFLNEEAKFKLAFLHMYLHSRSFPYKKIQFELYRLQGLLIVDTRANVRKLTDVVLFDFSRKTIECSAPDKIRTSIGKYQTDFRKCADNMNEVKAFNRSYIHETSEYLAFLQNYPQLHTEYISMDLKNSLKPIYQAYRKKSLLPGISKLIIHLKENPFILSKIIADEINWFN